MKWNDIFCNTFKELRAQIKPDVRQQVNFILPSWPMVDACRADSLNAFQPFIAAGKLSVEDMHQACDRYYLGKTKTGTPIYWMIDDMNTPLDAHIGNRWISQLLKQREPLIANWQVQHCLFGLHLLAHAGDWRNCCIAKPHTGDWRNCSIAKPKASNATGGPDSRAPLARSSSAGLLPPGRKNPSPFPSVRPAVTPISIVASESSAIVLSALFPETIWLAYATTSHLVPDLFAPLEGHIVTIYPNTDPTLSTYLFFQDLVTLTQQQYDLDITISPLLEDNATPTQKDRCIDLLDYLKESLNAPAEKSS